MRRFARDGRVWEIELDGKVFHVVDDGARTTRKFVGAEQAKAQHDKAVDARLADGWVEMPETPAPPFVAEPPLPLDDLDALLVRSDELQQQGDFRGELIALQVAHERLAAATVDVEEREELARRVIKLVDANAERAFGALAPHAKAVALDVRGRRSGAVVATFRRGVIDEVRLVATTRISLSEIWPHLATLPLAQHLRSLTCGPSVPWGSGATTYVPLIAAMCERGVPATLRELFLGDVKNPAAYDAGHLGPLYARVRGLERLRIHAGRVRLGAFDLPRLRSLELHGVAVDADVVSALRTPPALLSELSLSHLVEAAENGVVDSVAHMSGLRHLSLRGFPELDVDRLVSSEVLPGLETLDLSGNGLGEIGAQRLLEHAARFAHLRSLVIRLNGIAHEDVRRIRAALPQVDALGQVSPERFDDDRYDSIHE